MSYGYKSRGFGNGVFSTCIEDSLSFCHFFPILKVSASKYLLGKVGVWRWGAVWELQFAKHMATHMSILANAYLPNISAALMVFFRNKTEINALPRTEI